MEIIQAQVVSSVLASAVTIVTLASAMVAGKKWALH
jgi:hypothetical protein